MFLKKKTLLSLVLSLILVFTLVSCSRKPNEVPKTNDSPTETTDEKNTEEKDTEETPSTSKGSGFLERVDFDAKEQCTTAFGSDDQYLDYKIERTESYLNTLNTIWDNLDENFVYYTREPKGMEVVQDQGQFQTSMKSKYDPRKEEDYKYFTAENNITTIKYDLLIEDGDRKLTQESLKITLTDINDTGAIKLNDATKNMIKACFPDADLAQIQSNLDESYKNNNAGVTKNIRYESDNRDFSVTYSPYFKDTDTRKAKEISINITHHYDFPN